MFTDRPRLDPAAPPRRAVRDLICRLVRADEALAAWVWRHRTPTIMDIGRLVGALGDPWTATTATLLAAAPRGDRRPTLTPVIVVAGTAYARHRLAAFIDRRRPPGTDRLVPVDGPSFPSKHTTLAVLAAGAALRAGSGRGRYTGPAMVGLAVGSARMVVGAHWPADVAAGIVVGTAGWWIADQVRRSVR